MLAAALASAVAAAAGDDTLVSRRGEDLDAAAEDFVNGSSAFSLEARREALTAIARLKTRGGTPSSADFLLALMRIAAMAGNAHDSLMIADGWVPSTRLPLRMIWFPDGIVIARTGPGQEELLGATVQRIEGLTPEQLMARLRPYTGGTDDYLRWNLLWLVENGGLLHAMGAARAPDRLRLELTLQGGRRVHRSLAFVSRAELPTGVVPARLWSSSLTPAETGRGWRAAQPTADEPLYLRDGPGFFRLERLAALDALYLQFRANSTADALGEDISAFVSRVQEEVDLRPPRHLVLDLRFDIGGDIDQTRDLIRHLAARTRERIYVLTGAYTFSAGIVAAAAMVHDGGERVTVIGSPVGDRLRFWSEGRNACLPHSRYCFHASEGLWDLVHGCEGEPGCYGDRYDARVPTLRPAILAPLTMRAWRAGRDPGMEAVQADLAARGALQTADACREHRTPAPT